MILSMKKRSFVASLLRMTGGSQFRMTLCFRFRESAPAFFEDGADPGGLVGVGDAGEGPAGAGEDEVCALAGGDGAGHVADAHCVGWSLRFQSSTTLIIINVIIIGLDDFCIL